MIHILDAILAINSNAEVVVRGRNIDDCEIIWCNDTTEISKTDIKAKIAELQTTYDNLKYQRDRAKAYPSIGDQLDMIYKSGQGGDAFQAAIQAVKDKYPKG